ncbi:AAA family ATPase [Actinoplanes sp. NPDC049681]|uniref:AAA family ATPase n=1 Tax=Actinoplanes sp. NPDC049681 TaxID=3363905 RepID=UPI0037A1CA66
MMFTAALFEPAGPEGVSSPYRFTENVIMAINVALAAGRPLLVTGPPGSGKSTLARAVADHGEFDYVEHVFTSRSELSDLTAGFDAVRRLTDAQIRSLKEDGAYLLPGVLWWAFDPESAKRHLAESGIRRRDARVAPSRGKGTVVLLDEIDKADPDLPNDLLAPLDHHAFPLPDGVQIRAQGTVLVVITSNKERRLPPAFLRRCIHLEMAIEGKDFFTEVARAHLGEDHDGLYDAVADVLMGQRESARRAGRREPSTAEYLDTVRVCRALGIAPGSPQWEMVQRAALAKAPRDVMDVVP